MRDTFLPFSRPAINQDDIDGVVETLKSGWITTGPKTAAFEDAFRHYTKTDHACSLASGTAGMHLVLMTLEIGEGDEVITPSLTWGSTVNLITLAGATPVFVDVDRSTLMLTPEGVEKAVTDKTRAIIPVHYAGAPADLDPLRQIASRNRIPLIEDAAHALGTLYKDRPIGMEGTAIFSFHPIKNITTGEGGMVVSDNEDLIEKVRILKFHGLAKDAWQRYSRRGSSQVEIITPGYKYNMTDIQASLGLTQLPRVEEMNRKRGGLAAVYDRLLEKVEGIEPIKSPDYPHRHSHHLYIVILDIDRLSIDRDRFLAELKERNIGTGIHFRAVHTQDYYRNAAGFGPGLLPETEWISDRLFSLPLFPQMDEDDVTDVVEAIEETIKKFKT